MRERKNEASIVVSIRSFLLTSDCIVGKSGDSVCYFQFHHMNNEGYEPNCV